MMTILEPNGKLIVYNSHHPDERRFEWEGGPIIEVSDWFLHNGKDYIDLSIPRIGPYDLRYLGPNPTRMTHFFERVTE